MRVAQVGEAPPLVGVRRQGRAARRSSETSDASRARRRAAACRIGSPTRESAAVARSSATRAVRVSGRRGRSATGTTGTPSSATNRLGREPSSSGESTAVTTSRRPRAGDRDVEQPALLGEQLGGCGRRRLAVGSQLLGVEQRAAAPQVGPAVLLDVDDHDEVPLQPLAAVSGEHAHGVAAQSALGQGVGGDLLGLELLEEGPSAAALGAVLEARGGLEQRDDRVEVSVGEPTRRAAGPRGPLEPPRPRRAVPQRPEHVVGASRRRATPSRALRSRAAEPRRPVRRSTSSRATSRSGSASTSRTSSALGSGQA